MADETPPAAPPTPEEWAQAQKELAALKEQLELVRRVVNVEALTLVRQEIEDLKRQVTDRAVMTSNLQRMIENMDVKMRVLQTLGMETASGRDLDSLLSSLMEMMMSAVKCTAGSLLLLDEETKLLEFKVAKGDKADEVMKLKIPLGKGIVGWVAEKGLPKLIPEVGSEAEQLKEVDDATEFKTESILCVPLKMGERTIGVIELLNKIGRKRFLKDDLDLLTSLAGQVALVIENARLHLHAQQKIQELSALLGVSAILNSSVDLHKILANIMESATVMLNAEASSVGLVDEEREQIFFEVATGSAKDQLKEIRIPKTEGIAGWVVREQRSLVVNDVANDPRFYKKADEKTQFVTRSILAVPLRVRGKVTGVVEALNKIGGEFTKSDAELLEALAHQSAITIDNARRHLELKQMFREMVRAMAIAVEERDPYTEGHVDRMAANCLVTAEELGLAPDDRERVEFAALFHDLGKIAVDGSVLNKRGPLAPEEMTELRKHPELGAHILNAVKQFRHVVPGVLHHQERWDGTGYPQGLKGEEISIDGRIIAVADAFDALTSDRPYRKGLPPGVALNELRRCAGAQFDPNVVEAFTRAHERGVIRAKEAMRGAVQEIAAG